MDIVSYIDNMQINSRKDASTALSSQTHSDSIPKEVKTALDAIFQELMNCKPSWRTAFKEKEEVISYKKALGVAMFNAKINTMEKAQFGIAYAQLDSSPFFPSVGQFITWCTEGYGQHLKKKQLEQNMNRITDEKLMLDSKPFEERKAEAKANIADLRNILNKV